MMASHADLGRISADRGTHSAYFCPGGSLRSKIDSFRPGGVYATSILCLTLSFASKNSSNQISAAVAPMCRALASLPMLINPNATTTKRLSTIMMPISRCQKLSSRKSTQPHCSARSGLMQSMHLKYYLLLAPIFIAQIIPLIMVPTIQCA